MEYINSVYIPPLMTYQGNYTWLCISQWEPRVPHPQSRRQTLRRWPARHRECFHPSELRLGCRHKQKEVCFLCGAWHRQPPLGRRGIPVDVVRSVVIEGVDSVAQRLPASSCFGEPDLHPQKRTSRCIYTSHRSTPERMASQAGAIIFWYK